MSCIYSEESGRLCLGWMTECGRRLAGTERSPACPAGAAGGAGPSVCRVRRDGNRTLQAPGGDPGASVAGCWLLFEVPPPVVLALPDGSVAFSFRLSGLLMGVWVRLVFGC